MPRGGRLRSPSNSIPINSRELLELVIRADRSLNSGVPAWLMEQQHQVARRTKSLYVELGSAETSPLGTISPRQFLIGNPFKALERLVITRAYGGELYPEGLSLGNEGRDLDDADYSVSLDFDLVEASSLRTLIVEGIELSGGKKDPFHVETLSLSYAAMEWRLFASLLHGSTELRSLKLHHSRIDDAPPHWSLTLPWLRTLSIHTTHLRDLAKFLGNIRTFNLCNLDIQVQSVSPRDYGALSRALHALLLSNDLMKLTIGGHFAFIIDVLKILVDGGIHRLEELDIDSERRWPSDEIWRVHLKDAQDLIHQLVQKGSGTPLLKLPDVMTQRVE
ncbi:uncharacterized protein EI90DRAFT_3038953 [Cantharellus anzutake]|uniref:uncharacterized protein n=1 Tax=Cantharellus anzutake TaxID=1750568 RepID=UPI0019086497|nr:uncharacterized protein EI90DRAFT_3038953 [Cantharellus anzutake]KAF8338747.1 hypothetical protein EI90DRAFT_3038953 [Cantharellus anzutake]